MWKTRNFVLMMMLCFMLVGCGSNDEGDQATEDNNMNDETSEDEST